jgi:hypothetical protein
VAAGINGLYRFGDAVARRIISEAIFDGHRLAHESMRKIPASRSHTGVTEQSWHRRSPAGTATERTRHAYLQG